MVRIRRYSQTSLQHRMGVNSIEEQEAKEKRKSAREFFYPKKIYGRGGRTLAKAGRRKAKKVSRVNGVGIFSRLAPAKRRK